MGRPAPSQQDLELVESEEEMEGAGASSQQGKEMLLRNAHSPHKAPAALPPQIRCQQPLHLCKEVGRSSRKDRTATPTLFPTAGGKGEL